MNKIEPQINILAEKHRKRQQQVKKSELDSDIMRIKNEYHSSRFAKENS